MTVRVSDLPTTIVSLELGPRISAYFPTQHFGGSFRVGYVARALAAVSLHLPTVFVWHHSTDVLAIANSLNEA